MNRKGHIIAVVVLVAVLAVILMSPGADEQQEAPAVTGGKSSSLEREWGPIPKGEYTFSVSSAHASPVEFLEGKIDPPDVHVGDLQKFRVVVQSSVGEIDRVEAHIQTDNGTTTIPLQRTEVLEVSVESRRGFSHNGADKILIVEGKKAERSVVFAQENPRREVWEGEWIVRDTHDTLYTTEFIAYDTEGNSDSIEIAWSDLCGIPLSGDWSMSADNGGQSCSVGEGIVDGVDSGNATVDAGTLTVNGEFVWNSGKSISLSGEGKIVIGSGGALKEGKLFLVDADSDGAPDSSTQYYATTTAPVENSVERSTLVSATPDCNPSNASLYQNLTGYQDSDGDGYTTGGAQQVCSGASLPSGYLSYANGSDCNDGSSSVFRSVSGYLDSDGDGYGTGSYQTCVGNFSSYVGNNSDCNDGSASYYQYLTGYTDSDGDGYTVGGSQQVCSGSSLPSGYLSYSNGNDCNDSSSSYYQYLTGYTDSDGDGYGIGSSQQVCSGGSLPSGYASNASDCNDSYDSIWRLNPVPVWPDGDADGYASVAQSGGQCSGECSNPAGTTCVGNQSGNHYWSGLAYEWLISPSGYSDCDDYNASVYQAAYQDSDGDGYGLSGTYSCRGSNMTGYVSAFSPNATGDCNDSNASLYQNLTGYTDADGDGYTTGSGQQICSGASLPSGYLSSANGDDCNDSSASAWNLLSGPFSSDEDYDGYRLETITAPEICAGNSSSVNGRTYYGEWTTGWIGSNDCAATDGNAWQNATVYTDSDGDGYGTTSSGVTQCIGSSAPSGKSLTGGDCYDQYASVNPGAGYYSSPHAVAGWDYNCSGSAEKRYSGTKNLCSSPVTGNYSVYSSSCSLLGDYWGLGLCPVSSVYSGDAGSVSCGGTVYISDPPDYYVYIESCSGTHYVLGVFVTQQCR